MNLTLHLDREDDGRWIAEVPELPGALVYGKAQDDAITEVKALSLRILADRIKHGEPVHVTAFPPSPREPSPDCQEQADEDPPA